MKIFGNADERTIQQMENCLAVEDGALGVLCADNHLGYSMPIGGVVAYEGHVSPSAVGFDIGCGNLAVETNLRYYDIKERFPDLMREIADSISFGVGRKRKHEHLLPPFTRELLRNIAQSPLPVVRDLFEIANKQLGTVGAGNHYVDIFVDDDDLTVWVGVHFGSRGFGHKIATHFMKLAAGSEKVNNDMMAPPLVIPANSQLAQDYVHAMTLAGLYAADGRRVVVREVLRILGAVSVQTVHNHHNFAWAEEHGGRPLFVHRKGATPAFPGQKGFIGGSMGDSAVIVEGLPGNEEGLFSTVHGAGRAMSRTQAAGKVKRAKEWVCGNRGCEYGAPARDHERGENNALPRCPECGGKLRLFTREVSRTEGLIDWPATQKEIADSGILLIGGGPDEAPLAYKRLPDVLAAHSGTIVTRNVLDPIGVIMAGPEIEDPYKD